MLTSKESQSPYPLHPNQSESPPQCSPPCLSQWQKADFKGMIHFTLTVSISNIFFLVRKILISGINQNTLNISTSKAWIYCASENEGDHEGLEAGKCLFCFGGHLLQEAWVDTGLGRTYCGIRGENSKPKCFTLRQRQFATKLIHSLTHRGTKMCARVYVHHCEVVQAVC